MRQVITIEQRRELTGKQLAALMAWFEQEDITPVFNIGRLLWFLDEHVGEGWLKIERAGNTPFWRVQHKYVDFEAEGELIDVLWEAVKVVLEKKDDEEWLDEEEGGKK